MEEAPCNVCSVFDDCLMSGTGHGYTMNDTCDRQEATKQVKTDRLGQSPSLAIPL